METKYIIVVVTVIILLTLLISSSLSVYFTKSKPTTTPQPIVTTPPPPTQPTTTPFLKNITTTSVPISNKLQQFQNDINNTFAWSSMENVGYKDTNELQFLRSCEKPWNALYQLGCVIDGVNVKSQLFGPVSNKNLQTPILRVGDYNTDNTCSKLNGQLFVYRKRPNDLNMIDITQNLRDITNTTAYNRKDPLFIDDYKPDC